jgi:hypothetical protein
LGARLDCGDWGGPEIEKLRSKFRDSNRLLTEVTVVYGEEGWQEGGERDLI